MVQDIAPGHRRHAPPPRRRSSVLQFLLSLFLLPLPLAASERIKTPQLEVQWLAPGEFGTESTLIGIYFLLEPGWHVYWKNPGDSGAAPKFKISSDNATYGQIQWPFPERIPVAHLTNLGYEKEVAYLFEVQPVGSPLRLRADLEWLVCKEDCLPGFGSLTLERKAGKGKAVWKKEQLEKLLSFQTKIPAPQNPPWRITAVSIPPTAVRLNISPQPGRPEGLPEVFPLQGDLISPARPVMTKSGDTFELELPLLPGKTAPSTLELVLVEKEDRAWEIPDVPVQAPDIEEPSPKKSFWFLLILAFLGGLILNLMPCVFPVLSIKVFSLLKQSEAQSNSALGRLREGALYSAGVIFTFVCLGVLFLVLRAGGEEVGWGFQLQSPVVVLSLTLLFWLMALGFIGAIEFGNTLMRIGSRTGGGSSSFGTGVLSVFVAAPCTAPFMGTALGASALLPGVQAVGIFISLGAGLAAPFMILAASPALLARLPRPGAWMETLK